MTNQQIRAFWDAKASEAPESTGYQLFFRQIELNEVLRYMPYRGKVLDVGCGNGRVLEHVYQQKIVNQKGKNDLYGVDFSQKMVDAAQRILGDKAVVIPADATALPFPDETFDYVYTVRALINLDSDEAQLKALSEIRRVLKKNGIAVLVEATQPGFEAQNRFLHALHLKPLAFRWHNRFFSWEVLHGMKKIFFFSPAYDQYPQGSSHKSYPVTTAIKSILESLFSNRQSDGTPTWFQRNLNTLTNHTSKLTAPLDWFVSTLGSKGFFGKNETFVLLKNSFDFSAVDDTDLMTGGQI